MIDQATAHQICRILDQELDTDFGFDPEVEKTFVAYLGAHQDAEWRLFMTSGIKFRTRHFWHVDCYPEEERPELRAQIERANRRLDLLQFGLERRLER
jgi:hypothetical protein